MPSPLSSCAVCGRPTTSRCSGCANAGGPSIFFCSPEHQKLVWHNHKFVCREKSARFIALPLTDAEFARIDDYAERGRVSETATPGDESYRVRANLFEDMLAGCERDQLKCAILPSLRDPARTAQPSCQDWLHRLRLMIALTYGSHRGKSFQDCWPGSPWVFVAVLQNTVYAHWIDELGAAVAAELLERNSLVRFAHHVLIFYTLACLKDSSTNIQDSWVKTSFEAMIASINDDVMYTAETALHAPEMVGRIFRKLKAVRV